MKANLNLTDRIFLSQYRQKNPSLLNDPEFASWLDNEFSPLAGRWQY